MSDRTNIIAIIGLALAASPALAQPSSGGPWTISWWTIDAGGGESSGGPWTVRGTIGQPDAGETMTGGAWSLTGGFWAGVAGARPECVADINTKNVNPGHPDYGTPDGIVDGADLSYFVENWLNQVASVADINTKNVNPGDPSYGTPDGIVDGADLSYFVEKWLAGCI